MTYSEYFDSSEKANQYANNSNTGAGAYHNVNSGYTDYSSSGYNDYSSSGYNDYSSSGYNNAYSEDYFNGGWSGYNNGYNNHSNSGSGYNNHSNSGSGYNNHTQSGSGYNNHTNTYDCTQSYSNHTNYTIEYPQDEDINVTNADVNSWDYLTSAIADIKQLRDDIENLTFIKVKEDGTKFADADVDDPVNIENADSEFTAGKFARADQIDETVANLKRLWTAITGDSDFSDTTMWPVDNHLGLEINKDEYRKIIDRAEELASVEQKAQWDGGSYANHLNTGSYRWEDTVPADPPNYVNSHVDYINHTNFNDVSDQPNPYTPNHTH